jgi:tellurite resistance protein
MGGLFILFLAVALVVVVIIFPEFVDRSRFARTIRRVRYKDISGLRSFSDVVSYFKSLFLSNADWEQTANRNDKPDLNVLNCKITEIIQKENNEVVNAFSVEICGSIRSPGDQHHAIVRISIQDATEGSNSLKAVQSRVKQWQAPAPLSKAQRDETTTAGPAPSLSNGTASSSEFSYSADLGKLPHQVTTVANWTAVARLRVDWLVFPRKGKRNLLFNLSIVSADNSHELARTCCSYLYDNPSFGYIDVPENIEHTKTLAVALAFAVSAADNKMYDCEIELIKKWAKEHIDLSRESEKAEQKLDKALNEVIVFFQQGNQFDSFDICREIVEIAPAAARYEVMDLCLQVAKANGSVVTEELKLLKNIANWFEIDGGVFREMMDKVIPVEMHQVKDLESILGVTSDMNMEIARAHLNREYVKWNARVTNMNPEIQSQADQMLKLIAEARTQYVPADQVDQQEENKPDHAAEKKPVKKRQRKVKVKEPQT